MTETIANKEMVKPIRDQVLVKPFPSESVSEGGIILSEPHAATSNKMLVISVGEGTQKQPMRFAPGDIAFRVKDTGTEIQYNGEKYFLLPQSYLLATLK